MMTAMLTAKNILAGALKYDVWSVNQDAEYHEAGAAGEQAAKEANCLVPVSDVASSLLECRGDAVALAPKQ